MDNIRFITLLTVVFFFVNSCGSSGNDSRVETNSQNSVSLPGTYVQYPYGKSNPHIMLKFTFYSSGSYIFESTFGDGLPDYGEWRMTGDKSFKVLTDDLGTLSGTIKSSGNISVSSLGSFEKF